MTLVTFGLREGDSRKQSFHVMVRSSLNSIQIIPKKVLIAWLYYSPKTFTFIDNLI